MEEQTLHILNECSSGCKMAIHSMQQVLEYVENEKLEQVFGSKYSLLRWMDAKQAQIRLTNDSLEEYAARQQAKQKYKSISQPVCKRNHEQER